MKITEPSNFDSFEITDDTDFLSFWYKGKAVIGADRDQVLQLRDALNSWLETGELPE